MNALLSITKKELRAFFKSPVAVIFLAIFYLVSYFAFFTYERFFARNMADIRPFFQWLPLLLIYIVAAITMRQWSEEQKMGTLEVLMTLPIKTWQLVVGKFAAGMILVIAALLPTLSLPITVSTIGALDWGPVLGGYLAAILLASTYMAIGLSVSSKTQSQLVALMITILLCGLLYLVGAPGFVALFNQEHAEMLRSLGAGARFESIEKGVLDLRDLAYYLSLTAFFLMLNFIFIELKRNDRATRTGRNRWLRHWLTVLLVLANALALNIWLQPITAARADLTENGDYSLEPVTIELIRNLDEPMVISGYFSEKTHPKLAPLVPRLEDLLREYEIESQGKIKVEFVDPSKDEALEEQLEKEFGIRSFAVSVSQRNEKAVVNSYFHVLIQYGDQFQVLSFEELVEVLPASDEIGVQLRHPELTLTKTVRRLSQDFFSIEQAFAKLEGETKLIAYITPETLPTELAELPQRIQSVADELVTASDGRLVFVEVDPRGDTSQQRQLAEQGISPMVLLQGEPFYSYLVFENQGERSTYPLFSDIQEGQLRELLEGAVKRISGNHGRTIGLVTQLPSNPQPNQFGMAPPRERPKYGQLEKILSESYRVERLDLSDGLIPAQIDTLIVARPESLTEKAIFAIDQFLMRGGAVIALAGHYDTTFSRFAIESHPTDPKLLDLLAHYGVTVEDQLVVDPQNATFPVPTKRGRPAFIPYPFLSDLRRDTFDTSHLALSGLHNLVLAWSSPLTLSDHGEVDTQIVLRTSDNAWTRDGGSVELDPEQIRDYPQTGGLSSQETQSSILAVSMQGRFDSYFAEKANPMLTASDEEMSSENSTTSQVRGLLERSVPEARLVVIASSMFVSDEVLVIGSQLEGALYDGNVQFILNLIEWASEDSELLELAGVNAFARPLRPVTEEEQLKIELINYGVALGTLMLLVVFAWRGKSKALVLPPRLPHPMASLNTSSIPKRNLSDNGGQAKSSIQQKSLAEEEDSTAAKNLADKVSTVRAGSAPDKTEFKKETPTQGQSQAEAPPGEGNTVKGLESLENDESAGEAPPKTEKKAPKTSSRARKSKSKGKKKGARS